MIQQTQTHNCNTSFMIQSAPSLCKGALCVFHFILIYFFKKCLSQPTKMISRATDRAMGKLCSWAVGNWGPLWEAVVDATHPSSRSVGSEKTPLASRRQWPQDSRFNVNSPSALPFHLPPRREAGHPGEVLEAGDFLAPSSPRAVLWLMTPCTHPPGSLWHTHTCSHADLCSLLTHIPPSPHTHRLQGIYFGVPPRFHFLLWTRSHTVSVEGKPQQSNSSLSYSLSPELREEGSSSDAGLRIRFTSLKFRRRHRKGNQLCV